jgi:hypothetical protein
LAAGLGEVLGEVLGGAVFADLVDRGAICLRYHRASGQRIAHPIQCMFQWMGMLRVRMRVAVLRGFGFELEDA